MEIILHLQIRAIIVNPVTIPNKTPITAVGQLAKPPAEVSPSEEKALLAAEAVAGGSFSDSGAAHGEGGAGSVCRLDSKSDFRGVSNAVGSASRPSTREATRCLFRYKMP
jgi:hypothetical protein